MIPFIVGPDGRPLEINNLSRPETRSDAATLKDELRRTAEAEASRASTVNKKEDQQGKTKCPGFPGHLHF